MEQKYGFVYVLFAVTMNDKQIKFLLFEATTDDMQVLQREGCPLLTGTKIIYFDKSRLKRPEIMHIYTLLKQTIEKSIYKDCGEGKVLIRLKIQS